MERSRRNRLRKPLAPRPWATLPRRAGRTLGAVALVATVGTIGAERADAATSNPTLVLGTTVIPQGGSTTFTSTFTMDEGTAQATLNNLETGLTGTFDSVCAAPAAFTCTVNPTTGEIILSDGTTGLANTVGVMLTGTIAASSTMSTGTLPGLTITLNQGGSPQTSAPTPDLTITADDPGGTDPPNPVTDPSILASTSIPRGGSTTFTKTFTMNEGTAQATVDNLGTELTRTFTAVCSAVTPGAVYGGVCTVSPSGEVIVADGDAVTSNVTVTISGTITASDNFALTSAEGEAAMSTVTLPGLTISLSQGGITVTSAPTPDLTITANGATDAVVSLVTTAPAGGGVDAGRGTNLAFSADLTRTGNTNQATTAQATLVSDGTQLGTPSTVAPVQWPAGDDTVKTVGFTVAVPADSPTGSTGTYRIVVTYDPNTASGTTQDTETGAPRAFTVVTSYTAEVQQPIDADGSSVFSKKRGVVPVKFALFEGGSLTCSLPPAQIAIRRIADTGDTVVDEAVYTSPSDTGSSFRRADCTYHYNLAVSSLGAGTYEVSIVIDGAPVGSAQFILSR